MQITYNATQLRPLFGLLTTVARTRSALPILNCALVEPDPGTNTVMFTVNNLEQAITLQAPVLTDSNDPCVVPITDIAQLNTALNGTVVLDASNETVKLQCEQSEYQIQNFALVEEYPRVKATPTAIATIPTQVLVDLFQSVAHAASKEDARPVLKTVRLEFNADTLTAVATDTHRLVHRSIQLREPVAEPCALNVPIEAVQLLQRVHALDDADDCVLFVGDECATFQFLTTRIWTQLISGQYPSWQRVVPTETRLTASIEREALLDALRRIRIVPDDAHKVYLNFRDTLTITARGSRWVTGTEVVPLTTAPKEPIELAINLNYLEQAIRGFNGNTIILGMDEPLRPIKVHSGTPETHAAVVMPMVL
jgi:DNA polymerase-3 subunit beta